MTVLSKPSQHIVVACGSNKFAKHGSVTVMVSEDNVKNKQQQAA